MYLPKKTILFLFLIGAVALFTQCKSQTTKKGNFKNTDTYEFSDPKIINLPQVLDEISGISYYPKDTSVFAIIDEDGLLFKIPLNNPSNIKQWTFDKQRDFEDMTMRDSLFYVLISNGDIDILKFEADKINVEKLEFPNASKKVNEFEAVYFDSITNKLVLMCKHCEDDKKTKLSSFVINDSTKSFDLFHELKTDELFQQIGEKKETIKPSAVAVHPFTKDIYVLCSVNKLIFITDNTDKIKDVIKLNPKIYKQPEGMTFTPDGDLIISNEVYLEGYATLLLLKNKKKTKN